MDRTGSRCNVITSWKDHQVTFLRALESCDATHTLVSESELVLHLSRQAPAECQCHCGAQRGEPGGNRHPAIVSGAEATPQSRSGVSREITIRVTVHPGLIKQTQCVSVDVATFLR